MSMSKEDGQPSNGALGALSKKASHVLTVDVEDYFQVEAFADRVSRDTWDSWPCRVEASTRRVLDLFDEHQARGTFFFLGWVAERFPGLVRDVAARGHELACHSYWHRTIYSLTPEEFREDTRRAKRAIENAAGVVVNGYRAPSWSITRHCLWALDILAEEGFVYDSSIYPIHHDLYGLPGARRFPHTHACTGGRTIREYPPATVRLMGMTLPAAGGGYLRILPSAYTEFAFRTFENKHGERVVVYLHPWELDPEQPRIRGKLKSRVRHYTNLRGMSSRLGAVLQRHTFERFCDVFEAETPESADPNCVKSTAAAGNQGSFDGSHPVASRGTALQREREA